MSEAEVHALFDRLFPLGFAAQEVLDEIAPEGWERSPLLAFFYPPGCANRRLSGRL